jgi:hypothetical protein
MICALNRFVYGTLYSLRCTRCTLHTGMIDGGVMRLAARFVQRNVNSGKRHHHRAHHADFVNRPHKIRR